MSGQISATVARALDRVVSDNGWLAASRPGSLRAALSDVLGPESDVYRADVDAFVVSAEEGVPEALRTAGRAGARDLVPELVERLTGWGMSKPLALSVVSTWAHLVPEASTPGPVVETDRDDRSRPQSSLQEAPAPLGAPAFLADGPEFASPVSPNPPDPGGPIDGPRPMAVWVAAAAAVVLVIAAVGWIALRGGDDESQKSAASGSTSRGSALLAALAVANQGYAHGLIPPDSCHALSTDQVACIDPNPAVTRLSVTTYADKVELYDAYLAAVQQLRGAPLVANKGNCNSHAFVGERSWNHAFEHPDMYSIEDHISMDLTVGDKAQGRLACEVSGNNMTIVWTADSGELLGTAQGPVMTLFPSWKRIHHAIVAPGAGTMDDMSSDSMSGSPP